MPFFVLFFHFFPVGIFHGLALVSSCINCVTHPELFSFLLHRFLSRPFCPRFYFLQSFVLFLTAYNLDFKFLLCFYLIYSFVLSQSPSNTIFFLTLSS